MNILAITARIPFPVDDGGAYYVYHLLRELSKKNIHLEVASLLSANHRQDTRGLEEFCRLHTIPGEFKPYTPFSALTSLITRQPITVQHQMKPAIMAKNLEAIAKNFDIVLLHGAHTARYIPILRKKFPQALIVLQTANVEYEIHKREAELTKNRVVRFFLYQQYKFMKKFEFDMLKKVDAITFISDRDKAIFEGQSELKPNCVVLPGVRDVTTSSFKERDQRTILMFSSWKWRPNVHGLEWFLNNVWPDYHELHPEVEFLICGNGLESNKWMQHQKKNVNYVGFVDDLKELMKTCMMQVVPIISGSGVKIKTIEGLGAGIPIVSTPIGVEGLPIIDKKHALISHTAKEFSSNMHTLTIDVQLRESISKNAVELAKTNLLWHVITDKLLAFLESIPQNR